VRFQSFANAAYRTARSDSCDEDIDFAVRIAPDFLCGCFSMPGRVCRVFKLLQDNGAGCFITQCFRFGDGTFHPFRSGSEDQVGS